MDGIKPLEYKAKNLGEIADYFDKLAKMRDDRARLIKVLKEKSVVLTEARTYREAAAILRATTLKPEE